MLITPPYLTNMHSSFAFVAYFFFVSSNWFGPILEDFVPEEFFLEGSHSQACEWILEKISCSSYDQLEVSDSFIFIVLESTCAVLYMDL